MGSKQLLYTPQRITLRVVAGVDGDAEYAGLCGFYAVGYLHYGAIDLGGGGIGQGERLFGHVAEAVVFVERRGSGGGVAAGVLILFRELTLGVVFAAGVDEAARSILRGGHESLP